MSEDVEELKRKVATLESELRDVKSRCVMKTPEIEVTTSEEVEEAEPTTESEDREEQAPEDLTDQSESG